MSGEIRNSFSIDDGRRAVEEAERILGFGSRPFSRKLRSIAKECSKPYMTAVFGGFLFGALGYATTNYDALTVFIGAAGSGGSLVARGACQVVLNHLSLRMHY